MNTDRSRTSFCLNRHYSFLSFGGPQLNNLEALPFTYGQYVVIKLADKLYITLLLFIFVLRQSMSFAYVALQYSFWAKLSSYRLNIGTKDYEFCVSPCIFIHMNNFLNLPALGIEPLTLGLQASALTLHHGDSVPDYL